MYYTVEIKSAPNHTIVPHTVSALESNGMRYRAVRMVYWRLLLIGATCVYDCDIVGREYMTLNGGFVCMVCNWHVSLETKRRTAYGGSLFGGIGKVQ
jgi:hypothetical protein